ncbi:MAG: hypothetical protein KDD34_06115, partial [Bdellovibrionales bacterium]|nr:hypothetical protein [Bdellovibrionales bacterium]
LEVGDVLVFIASGEIREDGVSESGAPIRLWFPFESVEHALIYLGDGLIFQKENIGTDVFSIDTLKNTHSTYQKGFNRSPQYRAKMLIEAWR